MRKPLATLAMAALLALCAGYAGADTDEDAAHQALARGDIRPLDEVLAVAQKQLPGEVVKVKLEHEDGRWTYEIKILTTKGERREIKIDAASLRVIEVE